MKQDNYKSLGQYIQQTDVRNTNLCEYPLLGVSVEKVLIPSVANTIGTDFSKYKILYPNEFVYIADTSRRGDKIAIALNNTENPALVSSAYTTFKVDEDYLLSDYLMLWVSRPEFDRYARFMSHGSVRELFSWEEMCNVLLPVPPIEEQRRIVAEYQTVERRIKNNEAMIQKLEETAQAIYHHTFVEGIDENNLPEGWRISTIKDFCEKTMSGGTPDRGISNYWTSRDYRWLKSGEVQNCVVLDTEEWISESGLNNSSAKLIPVGTVTMAMYGATASQVAYINCDTTTNQACCNMIVNDERKSAYLYFTLKARQNTIKVLANGGAQENLNQEIIISQSIIEVDDLDVYKPFKDILHLIISVTRETSHLRTLHSLLTSKLA